MNRLLAMLTCAAALLAFAAPGVAQDRRQIIVDSYMEGFGRNPNGGIGGPEVAYWLTRNDWKNKEDLIRLHIQGLKSNGGLQQEAITAACKKLTLYPMNPPSQAIVDHWKRELSARPRRFSELQSAINDWHSKRYAQVTDAYMEAFGRLATGDEIKHWLGRTDYGTYDILMGFQRQWIEANVSVQRDIITRSYKGLFGREPSQKVVDFWHGIVKYGHTFKEVQGYHRRAKAQEYLTQAKGNPQMLAAMKQKGIAFTSAGDIVRVAPGQGGQIVAAGAGNIIAANGSYIVAAGAGNIVAAGGGNIVAAGGLNIVAAGGGN